MLLEIDEITTDNIDLNSVNIIEEKYIYIPKINKNVTYNKKQIKFKRKSDYEYLNELKDYLYVNNDNNVEYIFYELMFVYSKIKIYNEFDIKNILTRNFNNLFDIKDVIHFTDSKLTLDFKKEWLDIESNEFVIKLYDDTKSISLFNLNSSVDVANRIELFDDYEINLVLNNYKTEYYINKNANFKIFRLSHKLRDDLKLKLEINENGIVNLYFPILKYIVLDYL